MQQAKINKGDSLKKIQRIQMGNKVKAMDYKSPKKKMKKKRKLIVCSSYLNQKSSRGACMLVNIEGDD